MKKRLVVLSDLWGDSKNEWLSYYFEQLNAEYDIVYYDCCELGDVNKTCLDEQERHAQFVNYGINTAVEKLMVLEPSEIDILAFSIGGTVAWKAALKGLKVKNMYAVSSTRLRFEVNKPSGEITLIYGSIDPFIPCVVWFEKMNVRYEVLNNVGHELYRSNTFALTVCDEIKKK